MECGHNGCGVCCGGACSGCGSALELTEEEVRLLRLFAEAPFLPVARLGEGEAETETPVFLEGEDGSLESTGAALMGLAQKGLITIDYDIPLENCDYAEYQEYPCRGSMALTGRGQAVTELLDIQGIEG